ncbi:hypothetical protein, partial [uncultured Anaerotruncus sp.]|uniref:hypothetical protein n=1 Tax=uncultured Anaerotruncus sp. TaxID=905011 RepID=UPI00321F6D1D
MTDTLQHLLAPSPAPEKFFTFRPARRAEGPCAAKEGRAGRGCRPRRPRRPDFKIVLLSYFEQRVFIYSPVKGQFEQKSAARFSETLYAGYYKKAGMDSPFRPIVENSVETVENFADV